MPARDAELIAEWLTQITHLTREISRVIGALEALPPDGAETERSALLADLSKAMRSCADAGRRLAASLDFGLHQAIAPGPSLPDRLGAAPEPDLLINIAAQMIIALRIGKSLDSLDQTR